MRSLLLLLLLLACAASAPRAHGHGGLRALAATTYPKCTVPQTTLFTNNLGAASSGCTDSVGYDWGGNEDPSADQRFALCNCTVQPFKVPKCHWTKAQLYDVSVTEHFGYAYNCLKISGKATPNVTEIDSNGTTVSTTTAPKTTATTTTTTTAPTNTTTAIAAADCTVVQLSAFTKALTIASNGCMAATSYQWGGPTNPTDTQFKEICKCTSVDKFDIPNCSIEKGFDTVTLALHYDWVRWTECPGKQTSSSKVGLIVGILGGIVVVVAALAIAFVVYKRKRLAKEEHSQPTSHTGKKTHTDPRLSSQTNTTHTTISTTNGSLHASDRSSERATVTGKWDDPVIMAVRIPHDSIFFGSLLSRGGFGEVYKGTFKGETVAIKQLLPHRRKDLGQIDDFLGEVKLMSSLEHERIVKFIGVAWNSLSDACMVVEFMENGDLRSVLGRWDAIGPVRRMNGFDADKMKIALHIAHALVYLHSLQPAVVHRDLKSKNILLDENFDAKLTDFGISRERVEATMTAGVGSALWMAPEVMMGERYDEKADIFSFGVVLSELDTHQLPYFHAKATESGQTLPEAALLQQIMAGRISVGFTDQADPRLVQLGRECVNVDPKARPTTAQVLYRVHQALME